MISPPTVQLTTSDDSSRFSPIHEASPAATPEELAVIDNMLEGWMEIYERSIFNGKTLEELIDIN